MVVFLVLSLDFDSDVDRYESMFDDRIKHEIRIYITQDEWQGLSDDLLRMAVRDDYMRTGAYRRADFEYQDAYGLVRYENIHIRTKGNTSRVLPEEEGQLNYAHYKIKFDKEEDRKLFSLNELNLKSNMNGDMTYIREDYAYDFMGNYSLTSKSSFCHLKIYVDGVLKDHGLYTMIEPINYAYIKKNFPKEASKGNLYKCLWQNYGPANLGIIRDKDAVGIKNWYLNYRPTYDLITNNSDPNYEDLIDFTYNLTAKRQKDYITYLEDNFQVKSFLSATAANVALGMPDDYWAMGNNYYLYFNPLGKISYIPYDYDNVLSAGWDGIYFGGYEGIATADIMTWNDTASALMGRDYQYPLIEKTIKDDRYKRYYLSRFETILKDPSFAYEAFENKAHMIFDLYGLEKDKAYYDNLY